MTDLSNGVPSILALPLDPIDEDPGETGEWLAALDGVVEHAGPERARYLLDQLALHASSQGLATGRVRATPYANSIALDAQPPYPGDLEIEARLAAALRWNALAMVVRANRPMASWAAISPATPRPPTCSRSASTISSVPPTASATPTWSTSSRIRRRACMHAPTWRAFWRRRISTTTAARSPGPGSVPIRIRG